MFFLPSTVRGFGDESGRDSLSVRIGHLVWQGYWVAASRQSVRGRGLSVRGVGFRAEERMIMATSGRGGGGCVTHSAQQVVVAELLNVTAVEVALIREIGYD